MKFKLLLILTLLFFGIQNAFAEFWVPISIDVFNAKDFGLDKYADVHEPLSLLPSANRGIALFASDLGKKECYIDITSITRNENIMNYMVGILDNYNNKFSKLKMSSNLKDKTTAIIEGSVYKDKKLVEHKDFSKNPDYKTVNTVLPTLNEAVLSLLSYLEKNPTEDLSTETWQKYFKKYQHKLQRSWHPTLIDAKAPKQSIVNAILVIDKDGNIVYKNYTFDVPDEKYGEFYNALVATISNNIDKIGKFEPLPKGYTGNGIMMIFRFEYYRDKYAEHPSIGWTKAGVGRIKLEKNSSFFVSMSQVLWGIVKMPFELIYVIASPASYNSNQNYNTLAK